MSARVASDLSHKDAGCEPTQDGEIVLYAFAKRMRSNPALPRQA